MDKIRVIFCGTPPIAAGVLSTLLAMADVEVQLVVTQPDKPVGRKKKLTASAVKQICLTHHIPFAQPAQISTLYEQLQTQTFDFLITCAYGQFIPTKILKLARKDAINLHGSLLPKYRGGAPIQYALKNGDSVTGMTIMQMVQQMDAGGYYLQHQIPIAIDDNAGTLFIKMMHLAQQMLKEHLVDLAAGNLPLIAQDPKFATYAPNISPADERIVWNCRAHVIYNLVRSLIPTPIPHTYLKQQRYKIGLLKVTDIVSTHPPGTIVKISGEGIFVASCDYDVVIEQIQKPGKKMLAASGYYHHNLTDLKVGDVFA